MGFSSGVLDLCGPVITHGDHCSVGGTPLQREWGLRLTRRVPRIIIFHNGERQRAIMNFEPVECARVTFSCAFPLIHSQNAFNGGRTSSMFSTRVWFIS